MRPSLAYRRRRPCKTRYSTTVKLQRCHTRRVGHLLPLNGRWYDLARPADLLRRFRLALQVATSAIASPPAKFTKSSPMIADAHVRRSRVRGPAWPASRSATPASGAWVSIVAGARTASCARLAPQLTAEPHWLHSSTRRSVSPSSGPQSGMGSGHPIACGLSRRLATEVPILTLRIGADHQEIFARFDLRWPIPGVRTSASLNVPWMLRPPAHGSSALRSRQRCRAAHAPSNDRENMRICRRAICCGAIR